MSTIEVDDLGLWNLSIDLVDDRAEDECFTCSIKLATDAFNRVTNATRCTCSRYTINPEYKTVRLTFPEPLRYLRRIKDPASRFLVQCSFSSELFMQAMAGNM